MICPVSLRSKCWITIGAKSLSRIPRETLPSTISNGFTASGKSTAGESWRDQKSTRERSTPPISSRYYIGWPYSPRHADRGPGGIRARDLIHSMGKPTGFLLEGMTSGIRSIHLSYGARSSLRLSGLICQVSFCPNLLFSANTIMDFLGPGGQENEFKETWGYIRRCVHCRAVYDVCGSEPLEPVCGESISRPLRLILGDVWRNHAAGPAAGSRRRRGPASAILENGLCGP